MVPCCIIGKLSIPLAILDKKEKLIEKEYALIYKQPEESYRWVHDYLAMGENINKEVIEDIVLKHHRKLNYSGYPDSNYIKDDKLSLSVRIVTVADIFDALISPRSYKKSFNLCEAIDELSRCVERKEIDGGVVKTLINQVLYDSLLIFILS